MTSLLLFTAALLPQGPVPSSQNVTCKEVATPCLAQVQAARVVAPLSLAETLARVPENHGADEWQLVVDEAALRRASAWTPRRTLLQEPGMNTAGPGFYVQADLGLSFLSGSEDSWSWSGPNEDLDMETAAMFGLAAGVRIAGNWRVELSLNYRQSDIDTVDGEPSDGDTELTVFTANGYYDFLVDSQWSPYFGVALGNGWYQIDDSSFSESSTAFTWGVMAGVSYELTSQLDLAVGYRYQHMEGIWTAELNVSDLFVGVRYSF